MTSRILHVGNSVELLGAESINIHAHVKDNLLYIDIFRNPIGAKLFRFVAGPRLSLSPSVEEIQLETEDYVQYRSWLGATRKSITTNA